MKIPSSIQIILASLATTIMVSIPLMSDEIKKGSTSPFEITMQSSSDGTARVFFDAGDGFNQQNYFSIKIFRGDAPASYQFRIPSAKYSAILIQPLDHEGIIKFFGAKFLDTNGNAVKLILPSQIKSVQQSNFITIAHDYAQMSLGSDARESYAGISFYKPVELGISYHGLFPVAVKRFSLCFLALSGLFWYANTIFSRYKNKADEILENLSLSLNQRPEAAIAGAAVLAVILSCYPVIFFGKSFVSPNNSKTPLLYSSFPTLPGYSNTENGGYPLDSGAMMWAHLPYSYVESRALFHDFELPLWNRYNSSGVTLLGQGQSMFGDPLHFIVLLADGRAWAWDLKFILAKILFTAGIGLTVFGATKHLPASLILSFSSAFIGFFYYRMNHAAFFTVSYAPWILYAWFRITEAPSDKTGFLWMVCLVFANLAVINSGTVKEAYLMMVSLNFSGLLILALSGNDSGVKLRKFLQVVVLGALFILMTMPVWLTFLDTWKHASTLYDTPSAVQIHPALMIGLFDDLFHRASGRANPSANFLILLGFLWSITRFNQLAANRSFLAFLLSSLIPFALVFGIIPGKVITGIPVLRNVLHIDDIFSSLLIIYLIVLAGFGIKVFLEQIKEARWRTDFAAVLLIFLFLLVFYLIFYPVPNSTSTAAFSGSSISPLTLAFYFYAATLICAFVSIPWLLRQVILKNPEFPSIVLLLLGLFALHWRFGFYLDTALSGYVMKPMPRVDFHEKSPAIEFIKTSSLEPVRAAGFDGNLWPGYSGVPGIEGINGPDAIMNPYYRELLDALGISPEWGWFRRIRPESVKKLKSVYDLMNIKYFLGPSLGMPMALPGLENSKDLDLKVYQSNSTWPRAFFVNKLTSYESAPDFVALVENGDGKPFAAIQKNDLGLFPSISPFLGEQAGRTIVPASNYRLTNNTTSFTITTSSAGVAVLTESYQDDDFQATINGHRAPVIRVNHAFKGIQIDAPGSYTITFSYWPRNLTMSLWLAGLGTFMLLLKGISLLWKNRGIR